MVNTNKLPKSPKEIARSIAIIYHDVIKQNSIYYRSFPISYRPKMLVNPSNQQVKTPFLKLFFQKRRLRLRGAFKPGEKRDETPFSVFAGARVTRPCHRFSECFFWPAKRHKKGSSKPRNPPFFRLFFPEKNHSTKKLLLAKIFLISFPKEGLQTGYKKLLKRRASAGVQACRRARNRRRNWEEVALFFPISGAGKGRQKSLLKNGSKTISKAMSKIEKSQRLSEKKTTIIPNEKKPFNPEKRERQTSFKKRKKTRSKTKHITRFERKDTQSCEALNGT